MGPSLAILLVLGVTYLTSAASIKPSDSGTVSTSTGVQVGYINTAAGLTLTSLGDSVNPAAYPFDSTGSFWKVSLRNANSDVLTFGPADPGVTFNGVLSAESSSKVAKPSFKTAAATVVQAPAYDWSFYFNPVQISDASPDYASLPSSYPAPYAGTSIANYVVQNAAGQASPSLPYEWFHLNTACGTGGNEQCSNRNRLAPESGFLYQYSLEAAKEMVAIGARGIYLDAFNWAPTPCYNSSHGGHDEVLNGVPTTVTGGGLYSMKAQIDLVRDLETAMLSLGYPDWYQQVEMPVEYYFPHVEYSFCNQNYANQSLLADYGSMGPHSFSFPLFSAVYGDRHRLIRTMSISGNTDFESDPVVGLNFRQFYSADMAVGIAPMLGATLDFNTLAQKYGRPGFEPLTKAVDMLANYFKILSLPVVHELMVYGIQGRPIDTSSPTLAIPYPLPIGQSPPFPTNMALGPNQPYVYSSTWHKRPANDQPVAELGVLLTNWTETNDVQDPTLGSFFPNALPGQQTITLTIDPAVYDLAPKVYRVARFISGAAPTPSSVLDLSSGPGSITITVPEKSAAFLWLH